MIRIFNEEIHAKKMLENGFLLKKVNGYELSILAKYYFKNEKINRPKTRQKLIDFTKGYFEDFDEVKYRKMINSSVEQGRKYNYIKIENIGITQNEFKIIKDLNDIKLEKILFFMIIISKVANSISKQKYNQNIDKTKYKNEDLKEYVDRFFVCNKHSQIMNECKIKTSVKQRNKMFKTLVEKKLLDMTKKCNFKVLCIDTEGENILNINHLDEFVLEYVRKIGGKVIECGCCDKLVEVKRNARTKYCEECSAIVDKVKALERWKNKQTSICE